MSEKVDWERIERIFHGALERQPADRAEYIRRECAEDQDLRKRVESLLDSDDRTSPVDHSLIHEPPQRILGHYRLISKLAEGGMGIVYVAQDLRLDRQVAVKVLPADAATDRERQQRFIREAKAASGLKHPNIITVHDAGTEDNLDYIVMEYVAGKPLDRMIPRNGLKLKEALHYAAQIADALACAHRAGIVHRDLKPANVLIDDSSAVKLVDFGIAKQTGAGSDAATLTQPGLILGTVAYMSPEQVEAKPVDARSDIFSFGVMLYEMVTGRNAFQRDTTAATIAALLREEPTPVATIAEDIPAQVSELIEGCLRKLPADRFQSMNEVSAALERLKKSGAVFRPAAPKPHRRPNGLVWTGGFIILGIAAAAAVWSIHSRTTSSESESVLNPIPLTSYPGSESDASFSSDGTQVAFSWCKDAPGGGSSYIAGHRSNCNIYVKQIGVEPSFALTALPAAEFSPTWSPDGQWIAFLRLYSVKMMRLVLMPQRGGPERALLDIDVSGSAAIPPPPNLAWTPDSRWVVCPTLTEGRWVLSLVSVNSDERHILTKSPEGEWGDTAPAISPNGQTLLFSRFEKRYNLYLLQLSEQYQPKGEPRKIRSEDPHFSITGAWLPDGTGIVFDSRNGLWRTSLASSAKPQRISIASDYVSEPAVSSRGNRLAYTTMSENSNIWRLDLTGARRQWGTPAPLIRSTRSDTQPAVSPDGKRIAFVSVRSGSDQVWLCDRDGANPVQLTSVKPDAIFGAQWSPDGQSIVFSTYEAEDHSLYVIRANGGTPRPLRTPGGGKWPSWSRDGKWIYFATAGIWKIHPGGGEPVQLSNDGDRPHDSPDGKFVYFARGWPADLSVWKVAAEGGESTKIIDGVSRQGQWTVGPDGIYYFAAPDAQGRSEIRMYEFATGKTRTISVIDRQVDLAIAVSPDGRTILYPQFEQGSDLMLVEDFR